MSVRRIAANIAKLPEPRRSTHDDRLRENLKSIILIYAARTSASKQTRQELRRPSGDDLAALMPLRFYRKFRVKIGVGTNTAAVSNVRFTSESGHRLSVSACPLCAMRSAHPLARGPEAPGATPALCLIAATIAAMMI